MGWVMNLKGETKDTVDQGLFLDPGWYHVVLEDTYEDGETLKQHFEFKVVDGRSKGQKQTEKLNNPDTATTENGREAAIRRAKLFASRLDVIPEDAYGNEDAELDWSLAIGREFAIEIATREYVDNSGAKKTATGMTFNGLYPWGSDKIPNHGRKALGLPELPGGTTTAAGGKRGGGASGRRATHPDAGSGKTHAAVDTRDL